MLTVPYLRDIGILPASTLAAVSGPAGVTEKETASESPEIPTGIVARLEQLLRAGNTQTSALARFKVPNQCFALLRGEARQEQFGGVAEKVWADALLKALDNIKTQPAPGKPEAVKQHALPARVQAKRGPSKARRFPMDSVPEGEVLQQRGLGQFLNLSRPPFDADLPMWEAFAETISHLLQEHGFGAAHRRQGESLAKFMLYKGSLSASNIAEVACERMQNFRWAPSPFMGWPPGSEESRCIVRLALYPNLEVDDYAVHLPEDLYFREYLTNYIKKKKDGSGDTVYIWYDDGSSSPSASLGLCAQNDPGELDPLVVAQLATELWKGQPMPDLDHKLDMMGTWFSYNRPGRNDPQGGRFKSAALPATSSFGSGELGQVQFIWMNWLCNYNFFRQIRAHIQEQAKKFELAQDGPDHWLEQRRVKDRSAKEQGKVRKSLLVGSLLIILDVRPSNEPVCQPADYLAHTTEMLTTRIGRADIVYEVPIYDMYYVDPKQKFDRRETFEYHSVNTTPASTAPASRQNSGEVSRGSSADDVVQEDEAVIYEESLRDVHPPQPTPLPMVLDAEPGEAWEDFLAGGGLNTCVALGLEVA